MIPFWDNMNGVNRKEKTAELVLLTEDHPQSFYAYGYEINVCSLLLEE